MDVLSFSKTDVINGEKKRDLTLNNLVAPVFLMEKT